MDSSKYNSNKKDDSSNKSTFGSFGSGNGNKSSNDRKVSFANPMVTKFIEEDPAHAKDMLHSRVNYWR